jgi:nucleotide-binding universal stress UspA family protein
VARIVVGVDDSPGGRLALRWALDEAELRHAELEVVHVWTLALIEGWNSEWPADAAFLDKVIAESGHRDGVTVTPVPLQSQVPAFGLLGQAAGADLLVLGSRGRGGFTGLLLGSVSTQCVHHATCPVVVVKLPETTSSPT